MIAITRWMYRVRRPLLVVGFVTGLVGVTILLFTSHFGLGLIVTAVGGWLTVPAFMTVWTPSKAPWLAGESPPPDLRGEGTPPDHDDH